MKNTFCAALLVCAAAAFNPASAQVSTEPVSGTQSGTDTAAVNFATKATMSNMMEISSSKMAQERATSDDVKKFAATMIDHHTTADQQLKSILKNKKMSTTGPGTADNGTMGNDPVTAMRSATGAEFDKQYIILQLNAHNQAIALFERASRELKDPDLKAFATRTLPILREHLTMAKTIAEKLKVDTTNSGQ